VLPAATGLFGGYLLSAVMPLSAPPLPPVPALLDGLNANDLVPGLTDVGASNCGFDQVNRVLSQRLQQRFPAGTPEHDVIRALNEDGFKLSDRCEEDPSVYRAVFHGRPNRSLEVVAFAYWKLDDRQTIAWIGGDVGFIGL